MIEVSVYYLIGSVIIIPSITLYFTRRYYKKLIKEMNDKMSDKMSEEMSEESEFERNKFIVDEFFRKQQIN